MNTSRKSNRMARNVVGFCLALLVIFLWMKKHNTGILGNTRTGKQMTSEAGSAGSPGTNQIPAPNAAGDALSHAPSNTTEPGSPEQQDPEVAILTAQLQKAEEQRIALETEVQRQAARAEAAESKAKAWRDSILGGFKSTDDMMAMGARQLVISQYSELLKDLNLDEATKGEVASIIELAYMHNMKQGIEAVSGNTQTLLSDSDYAQWMYDELSAILSPEDLKVFQDYHASRPGGMGGQLMDMQLKNLGNFTETDRTVIRDTLIEVGSTGWDQSLGIAGMYSKTREKLVPTLGEQELEAYDRFVEQQLSLIKMAEMVTTEGANQAPADK